MAPRAVTVSCEEPQSSAASSSGGGGGGAAGGRFEMVSREKYLKSKQAASTVYYELEGGIRCCDQKVGHGAEAEVGCLVGVHFEGFRLNGRPLESSWNQGPSPKIIEAGNSPDFPALGAGVVGMKEGGRRELVVPPWMNREGTTEVMTYTLDLYKVSGQRRAPSPPGSAATSSGAPAATGAGASNAASSTDAAGVGDGGDGGGGWRRWFGLGAGRRGAPE